MPHKTLNKTTESRVLKIRETIAQAKLAEAKSHYLHRYIEAKIPVLHHTISLPTQGATEAMERFITHYIDHVPDFIEALTRLSQEAGVYEHAKAFLTIAEDYFLSPPDIVNIGTPGLKALIDEAYLAHRLIEEINDRMMMACGVPVTPMDMTLSNIIIHELLNDDFANQLDLAVHYAIESLFQSDSFFKSADFTSFLQRQQQEGWEQALKDWPCLAGDSSISLSFENSYSGKQYH